MKRRLLSFMFAAMLITSGASVYAAEGMKQETVFNVTPRVWFAYADLSDQKWFDSDAIFIPMYGLSVSVTPGPIPNWSLLVNGYTGTSDGNIVTTQPGLPYHYGRAHYERFDIELLVRYTIPGTGLGLYLGPRYINWHREQKVPTLNDLVNKTDLDIWKAQIGVSYVSEIGESGKHRLFSNLSLGVAMISGKANWTQKYGPIVISIPSSGSGNQPFIDGNIGYEYFFGKLSSATLRYRFYILREDWGQGQEKFTSFHGPEVGLSLRF